MSTGQMVGHPNSAEFISQAQAQVGLATAQANAAAASAAAASTSRDSAWLSRAVPKTYAASTGIPAPGARVARAVGLRAVLRSRGTYGALAGVQPSGDGSYNALWLRDLYMMALPYPGWFTAAYLRPIVDAFVASIGGEVANPNYPAERIETNGNPTYRPGPVGAGYGALPAFDSAPYLALLASLTYERGDLTVFSTHRAKLEQALEAAPRSASGLLYSNPAAYSVDWGFQDTCRPPGDVGMGSALHALAYRRLEAVALADSNVASAEVYRSRANALITALRTIRRTDGFYKPSSGLDKRHAMLTALIVAERLCSDGEAVVSAQALLAAYRGGTITERGAMRHLVLGDYFTSGVADTYQNGGYWLGEWIGWLARSFESIGASDSARKVMKDAVDELLREHRVDALAPWEWSYASTRGAHLYGASTAFLAAATEAYPTHLDVTLAGANGSTRMVPLPDGCTVVGAEVWAGAAATATVTVYGAALTAALADPPAAPPLTFGSETTILSVALSAEAGKRVAAGSQPAGVFGGYVRLAVTSGSSANELMVRLLLTPAAAAWADGGGASSADAFGADTSANYTAVGTWTISGGRLRNAAVGDAQSWLLNSISVADMRVSAVLRSSALASRFPCLAVRAVDAANQTFVLLTSFAIRVYDRVAGVDTKLGADIAATFANDTDYTVMVEVIGTSVRVTYNGTTYTRTTTRGGTGKGGVRLGSSSGSAEIQFDDLTVLEYPPAQPVPPGMVQESASSAQVAGEVYPVDTAGGLRDEFGRLIAATPVGYTRPVLTY